MKIYLGYGHGGPVSDPQGMQSFPRLIISYAAVVGGRGGPVMLLLTGLACRGGTQ